MNFKTENLSLLLNDTQWYGNEGQTTQTLYSISDEVFYIIDMFMTRFLLEMLIFLGILGNSATIRILVYNGFSSTTNIALTALAVSDLFYSITNLLIFMFKYIQLFDIYKAQTVSVITYISLYYWNQCSISISMYLVSIIAFERMIAVWFPFSVTRIITPVRMTCIVITVYVAMLLDYVPDQLMITFKWTTITVDGTNITFAYLMYSEFHSNNRDFYYHYRVYFLNITTVLVPGTIIIVSSVMIIVRLTISARNVRGMSSTKASDKRKNDMRSIKITLTLCVSLVVLVLIPSNTFDLLFAYGKPGMFDQNTVRTIQWTLFNIFQLNASINFIIYVTMNSKFSKTYKKLFCCSA